MEKDLCPHCGQPKKDHASESELDELAALIWNTARNRGVNAEEIMASLDPQPSREIKIDFHQRFKKLANSA